MSMNKRDKKRIQALRGKIDNLRLRLAGARQQADDPGEVGRREAEIAAIEAEIKKLKGD